jgi:predicted transcriptional regulator
VEASAFIKKWQPGGTAHELNERAGAQTHFIDLCRLLGVCETPVARLCYSRHQPRSTGSDMSTTTLRLPADVKERIDRLAAAAGKTPHAFMVEALVDSTQALEQQRAFDAEVARRWAKLKRTGEYHTLDDVRSYLLAKARGESPPRPQLRRKSPEELKALRASDRRGGGG